MLLRWGCRLYVDDVDCQRQRRRLAVQIQAEG